MQKIRRNPSVRKTVSYFNDFVRDYTPFVRLAHSMSIEPGELFIIEVIGLVVLGLIGFYDCYTVTLFSSIRPAYMSLTSIIRSDHEKQKRWLLYWIVVAIFTGLDRPVSQLLYFLPGYYNLKMLFLYVISLPTVPFLDSVGKTFTNIGLPFSMKMHSN